MGSQRVGHNRATNTYLLLVTSSPQNVYNLLEDLRTTFEQ